MELEEEPKEKIIETTDDMETIGDEVVTSTLISSQISNLLFPAFLLLSRMGYTVFDILPDPAGAISNPDGIAWRWGGRSVAIYCITNDLDWRYFQLSPAYIDPSSTVGNGICLVFNGFTVPEDLADEYTLIKIHTKGGNSALDRNDRCLVVNIEIKVDLGEGKEWVSAHVFDRKLRAGLIENKKSPQALTDLYMFHSLYTMAHASQRKRYHFFPKASKEMFPFRPSFKEIRSEFKSSMAYIREETRMASCPLFREWREPVADDVYLSEKIKEEEGIGEGLELDGFTKEEIDLIKGNSNNYIYNKFERHKRYIKEKEDGRNERESDGKTG